MKTLSIEEKNAPALFERNPDLWVKAEEFKVIGKFEYLKRIGNPPPESLWYTMLIRPANKKPLSLELKAGGEVFTREYIGSEFERIYFSDTSIDAEPHNQTWESSENESLREFIKMCEEKHGIERQHFDE